ncbi:hypothetical protein MIR68_000050 [Amoeboaphelidium protococcarum]|nr:hypothetical protein MIR68_000050 [Amoeboaphelidium protococcarum]
MCPIRGSPVMTQLVLQNQNLSNIIWLTSLKTLAQLDLSNNVLTCVPSLINMRELTSIKLSGNRLTKMPELPLSIEYVNLSDNSVQYLELTTILPRLTTLNISGNMLESFDAQSLSECALQIPDQYHVKSTSKSFFFGTYPVEEVYDYKNLKLKSSLAFANMRRTVIVKNGQTSIYYRTTDSPYECVVYQGIPRDAFKKPEYQFTRLTEFADKKVKEYASALNNRDGTDYKKWLYVDVATGARVGALEEQMLITGDWIETKQYVDYYSEEQLDESAFQPPADVECQDGGVLSGPMSQNFQQFVMQHGSVLSTQVGEIRQWY